MIAFIDDHRSVLGIGPICRVLGIAPSTDYGFKSVERDPELASDRARQDRLDMIAIKEAFDGSRGRYGARKVFAIGLERMATRWLTTSCAEAATTSPAARWRG